MTNTRRPMLTSSLTLLAALAMSACSLDGLINSDELPPDVSDPAITQTPDGARAAYHGVLAQFRLAYAGDNSSFVDVTGLLGDELQGVAGTLQLVDRRAMVEGVEVGSDAVYSNLQKVRGQGNQAIGLLRRYLPQHPALAAHLYALQGYAELFLAELFCSGIPLGTLDYDDDFTYQRGSTTEQVLARAVARFDSALMLAGDSARIADLARVGRARTLLAMGDYVQAATTVAEVDDDYRYEVRYSSSGESTRNFAYRSGIGIATWKHSVPDREGFNGQNWRTSADPRTQVRERTYSSSSGLTKTNYHPIKYDTTGASPVVLASGLEARLIEAEAALQANPAGGIWLEKLNALRRAAPAYTPSSVSPAWPVLPDTTDPGTSNPNARVDLLFRERAFWLFLTGHRQGDLRRLIRQYGRLQSEIYPIGAYPESASPFGGDVTAPIPATEFVNPLYTGCASRGA